MNKKGFTLIELLVVIAIVGSLSSVIVTQLGGARDDARIAKYQTLDSSINRSQSGNIIGEWLFNENASTARDTSGNGNHGILNNVTWIENGGFDGRGAYLWDEESDNINIGNNPQLNPSEFTISMWVKPPENNPEGTISLISNTNGCCGSFFGYNLNINKFAGGTWRTSARVWNSADTAQVREVLFSDTAVSYTHLTLPTTPYV